MSGSLGRVDDDEKLFRRIPKLDPAGVALYSVVSGKVKFSSSAFNDRSMQPSVDREGLRSGSAEGIRRSVDDGVATLRARAVRTLRPPIQSQPPKQPGQPKPALVTHATDVVARPLKLNCAHAEVHTDPAVTKAAFKRLKEALVRIAESSGWHVAPGTALPPITNRVAVDVWHALRSLSCFVLGRIRRS